MGEGARAGGEELGDGCCGLLDDPEGRAQEPELDRG